MDSYENLLEESLRGKFGALSYLQSCAEKNDEKAQHYLAQYYLLNRDIDNYNKWSELSSQNGYVSEEQPEKENHSFKSLGLLLTGGGLLLAFVTGGQIVSITLIIAGLSLIIFNK